MTEKLFEAALGLSAPWSITAVQFDTAARTLTLKIDFTPGSRFAIPGVPGDHPVHDTVLKRLRHLNFFQHECYLEVRTPRVRLPEGGVRLVEPAWAGHLSGFTLLFEALLVALAQQMPFRGVARLTGRSVHRVMAVCSRYVELAQAQADYSAVTDLALDETSRARGHDDITLSADAVARRVIGVTEGRDAAAVDRLAEDLRAHGGDPAAITSMSMDMSPAFLKGVPVSFPHARITFDKFHVIAHASAAVDQTRRREQKTDPTLKGMRWTLLKNRRDLPRAARAELDGLLRHLTTKRTARAWLYREQLREILGRKQIHVLSAALRHWCTNVMRSKVEAMKPVARLIRRHFAGIVAWAQTRATNGFLEALNGLFQAAKRKARGYGRLTTIRTVIFLLAGKLDFAAVNPHLAPQPT